MEAMRSETPHDLDGQPYLLLLLSSIPHGATTYGSY